MPLTLNHDGTITGSVVNTDVANTRVGIGTNTPKAALHVNGSTALQQNYSTYLVNAYYDSGWKYIENGSAWGIGNNFGGPSNGVTIASAATNSSGAGAALTFTPRLNINSAGQVTTPYQPAFNAVDSVEGTYTYGEAAGQTYSTSYKDVFPVGPNLAFTQNTGGHAAILPYSQGYYLKFTAPVAGWYMFGCNVLTQNSSTTDYWALGLEVNNTASVSTGTLAYYFGHMEGITTITNIGGSVQVYLNANDFVVWYSRSADTVTKHQMSNFWGRLVG